MPNETWRDEDNRRFRPYEAAWFDDTEILVRDGEDLARVEQDLRLEYDDIVLTRGERRMGIVRLGVRGTDANGRPIEVDKAIDRIRKRADDERRPRPDMSPMHTSTIGQPNVVGNPGLSPPEEIGEWQEARQGDAGEGVTVALIDTGAEEHPWLEKGYVAMPQDVEEQILVRRGDIDVLGPQAGHGCFLAGLVLQMAPAATVRMYKTANSYGESAIDVVAETIVRAAESGADVINLSLGCFTREDNPPWTLELALESIASRIAVVASAGNSGLSRKFWPGAFDRVTAVGAITTPDDPEALPRLTEFTNRGDWVDAYVPAVDVASTYIRCAGKAIRVTGDDPPTLSVEPSVTYDTRWARWSGTSMAAALWSGAIARAYSLSRPEGRNRGRYGDSPAKTAQMLLYSPPAELGFVNRLDLDAADAIEVGGAPRRAFRLVRAAGPGRDVTHSVSMAATPSAVGG